MILLRVNRNYLDNSEVISLALRILKKYPVHSQHDPDSCHTKESITGSGKATTMTFHLTQYD